MSAFIEELFEKGVPKRDQKNYLVSVDISVLDVDGKYAGSVAYASVTSVERTFTMFSALFQTGDSF